MATMSTKERQEMADERQEMADEVRKACGLIVDAADKLRAVCEETGDDYRLNTMVAQLEQMCDTGGWLGLDSEKLEYWAGELEDGSVGEELEDEDEDKPEELELEDGAGR